jgi:asparagine synthase (glutamine-hydrolysing)
MQDRLPDEILKFRKVGLGAPWGDYAKSFKVIISKFIQTSTFKIGT